jgi:ribosomal protein S18 acetylase RimI-like enzyme
MDVAPLEEAELAQVADVLACAFRDNALNCAVIGSNDPSRRYRSNRYGMLGLLPVAHDLGCVLAAKSGGAIAGALVSSPPNRFPLPAPAWWPWLRCLMGQGWRVARRWGNVFDALLALHPIEPHWYLATLGVDPMLQRRGAGSALLEEWLMRVDRSGMPAYLETDDASNVAFYQRAGFRVTNETEILGVSVWCMTRPAATPRPTTKPTPTPSPAEP